MLDEAEPIWRQLHEGLGLEQMVAEGEVVAVRYTERGTLRGTFMGNEPTGKSYEMVAMEWFVLRDGRIHRRRGDRDPATRARRIGLLLA